MDAAVDARLRERFGRDAVVTLATACDGAPRARYVNACYADGSSYVVTHARSAKFEQLMRDPRAAIAGEWLQALGVAEDLGPFSAEKNAATAAHLRQVFADWIDNGHNDLASPETRILRIRLTGGALFWHGARFDLEA